MLIFTSENFEKEVLQSDKPVLVDFFATWCGPCKAMHPVLEELDLEEDFKVGQVDIDEYPELVSKYRIMSVPFFIVFKNGEVAGKTIGVQSKEELLALIREHLWKSLKFFDDKAVIYCHLCTPHILSVIVILGCERCRYLCNFHNY